MRWPAVLLLGLIVLGCSQESDPTLSVPEAGGIVSGEVLAVDGSPVVVFAWSTRPTSFAPRPEFQAWTDSLGRFEFALAEGSYVFGLRSQPTDDATIWHARDGLSLDWRSADTVEVRADVPLHLEFAAGAVAVHCRAPRSMEGGHLGLRVLAAGDSPWPSGEGFDPGTRAYGRIAGGSAELCARPLVPGRYLAGVRGLGSDEVWLRSEGSLDTILVEAGRVAERTLVADSAPARLSGRILGSWLAMRLDPPRLGLVSADSFPLAEVSAAPDGGFRFDLAGGGAVKLRITIAGVSHWYGGRSFRQAALLVTRPGEEISGLEWIESGILLRLEGPGPQLFPAARIAVIDSAGGVEADLFPAGQGESRSVIPIPNLDPGVHYLRVRHPSPLSESWLPQWYDGASSREDATPIRIANRGDVAAAEVALQAGGAISGDFESESGLAQATVFVFSAVGRECFGSVRGRSDGGFRAGGLPDGDYRIGTIAGFWLGEDCPDPLPPDLVWYPSTAEWDSAMVIPIRNHEVVTGIHIRLP